jgi:RHS repeat-associated protein
MITDGNGNVLAGGERGGKSHITYKPYGEILRTDSYGPDITKFKYTGQEEDRESGLYYYKARYYDASLGRFISNDSMVFPNKEQGMNRQMYVEGNPISWRDKSGNNKNFSLIMSVLLKNIQTPSTPVEDLFLTAALTGNKGLRRGINDFLIASFTFNLVKNGEIPQIEGLSDEQMSILIALNSKGISKRVGKAFRNLGRNLDHTLKAFNKGASGGILKAAKGIDGTAREIATGGKFHRNREQKLKLGRCTALAIDVALKIAGVIFVDTANTIHEATKGFLYAIGYSTGGQDANQCAGGPTVEAWGR